MIFISVMVQRKARKLDKNNALGSILRQKVIALGPTTLSETRQLFSIQTSCKSNHHVTTLWLSGQNSLAVRANHVTEIPRYKTV